MLEQFKGTPKKEKKYANLYEFWLKCQMQFPFLEKEIFSFLFFFQIVMNRKKKSSGHFHPFFPVRYLSGREKAFFDTTRAVRS